MIDILAAERSAGNDYRVDNQPARYAIPFIPYSLIREDQAFFCLLLNARAEEFQRKDARTQRRRENDFSRLDSLASSRFLELIYA